MRARVCVLGGGRPAAVWRHVALRAEGGGSAD